jgi:hypothetical protein
MSLFKTHPPGLKDYVRVEHTPDFVKIFDHLFSLQDNILYNHSRIFPFSYLNKGRMKLYLNKDFREDKIIPVVQQFEAKPQYNLFTPHCELDDIWEMLRVLDPISSIPVEIIDVDITYADNFLNVVSGWKKVKTSDDIIQDAQALSELKGRNFSSLRNTLKHVREDMRPCNVPLRKINYEDAIKVFEDWKENQGKKYFRVTVGRDIRLIEEYVKYDRLDYTNTMGFIHYVEDKPVACSFGCRSSKDPAWGIDVTCKANINYKGMGDFAFTYLMGEMWRKGIKYINDSGGTGKVKINKLKFSPLMSTPMYSLVRK